MKRMKRTRISHAGTAIAALLLLGGPLTPGAAAKSEEACRKAMLRQAGRYLLCRMRAEAQAVGDPKGPDLRRCDERLRERWERARRLVCPGGEPPAGRDAATVQSRLDPDLERIADIVQGLPVPECGDGVRNGQEQCDGSDLGGATCASLGYTGGGSLACAPTCDFDVSGCKAQALPGTDQNVSYAPGDDGALRPGAPLSFTDNGDGTITDNNTLLMWEKKDRSGGLHDVDARYGWHEAMTEFIAALNNTCANDETVACDDDADCAAAGVGGPCGFAGYRDWRLLSVKELHSIVDYSVTDGSPVPRRNVRDALRRGVHERHVQLFAGEFLLVVDYRFDLRPLGMVCRLPVRQREQREQGGTPLRARGARRNLKRPAPRRDLPPGPFSHENGPAAFALHAAVAGAAEA